MATDIGQMNDRNVQGWTEQPPRTHEERTTAEVVTGGSVVEAIVGAGAGVVAIVGLAGIYPTWMAAISAIAAGAALFLRGVTVSTRFYSLMEESASETPARETELGSGIGAEVIGGAGVITLGILALLGLAPLVLIPVAAIVAGASLLFGCASNRRLNDLFVECRYCGETHTVGRIVGDILSLANGAQALVGIGAVVLGIIALVNPNAIQLTLSLVAFLAAGASLLLSGGLLTGKMAALLMRA